MASSRKLIVEVRDLHDEFSGARIRELIEASHFNNLPLMAGPVEGLRRVLFVGWKVKAGLTLVGVFQEGSTLTCKEKNSINKKENPGPMCSLFSKLLTTGSLQ
jgi:hypothetical protein